MNLAAISPSDPLAVFTVSLLYKGIGGYLMAVMERTFYPHGLTV